MDANNEDFLSTEKKRLSADIADARVSFKKTAIVSTLSTVLMFSMAATALHTSLTAEESPAYRNQIAEKIIGEKVSSQTGGKKDKVAADLLKAFGNRGSSEEILAAKIPEKEIAVSAGEIEKEIRENLSQLSESNAALAKIFSVFGLILAGVGIFDYRADSRKIAALENRLARLDGPG